MNYAGDPWEELLDAATSLNPPANFNFVTDVFDKYAITRKNEKALWIENDFGEERIWTFEDLRRDSILTAAVIRRLIANQIPVGNGDYCVVLVILPNVPEYWFTLLASLRLGIQFSPATLQLSASDVAYRITQCKPALIITNAQSQLKIEQALGQVDAELASRTVKMAVGKSFSATPNWASFEQLLSDAKSTTRGVGFENVVRPFHSPAYIFFTSGTTGSPKMVVHSQGSYALGNVTSSWHMKLKRDDVHYGISDPGWVAVLFSTFGAWNLGACLYVHQMERFTVTKVINILQKKPITSLFAPPTFIRALLLDTSFTAPFRALRKCSSGGEALTGSLVRNWKERTGLDLHHLYAQTETTFSVGFADGEEAEPGSMGRGMHGYRVGILDKNGNEVEPGENGILAINLNPAPHGLFIGYLTRTKDDILQMKRPATGNWYLSGDIVYRTKDGNIYFVAREDDIIISSAYRIGPSEVEEAVNTHPAVVESAVVGVPHELRGSVIKAFVVLRNEWKSEAQDEQLKRSIQEHVKRSTAPYKYPRQIQFVSALPKTPSGKIIRTELRKQNPILIKN